MRTNRVGAIFLFIQLLVVVLRSNAAITNIAVPSYFTQTINGTTVTIYAGRADPSSYCSNVSSDTPCDSCGAVTTLDNTGPTSNPIPACNKNSVFGKLGFSVTFTTDNAGPFTTASKVLMVNGTNYIEGALASGSTIVQGRAITARFAWEAICPKFGSASDTVCAKSFSTTVQIGVSKDGTATLTDSFTLQLNYRSLDDGGLNAYHTNCSSTRGAVANEGVCGFAILPGDAKVIFANVLVPLASEGSAQNSWPTPPTGSSASGVPYIGLKVYYRKASSAVPAVTDWQAIAPGRAGTYEADLLIDENGAMNSTRVTGLENESTYVFAIASIDKAGNISNFSDVFQRVNADFYNETLVGAHYGTPGEVVGLLANKRCFIATAAFGSEQAPQVEILRKFRNQFLLRNKIGRSLVQTYYAVSPAIADYISKHEGLRNAVRYLLIPLIGWSEFCLRYGLSLGVALLFGVFGLASAFYRRVKKTRQESI